MKNLFKILLIAFAMALPVSAIAVAADNAVTARIEKNGTSSPLVFTEGQPILISQSDTPVAMQFERTGDNLSVTLFEPKFYDMDRLKKSKMPIHADSIIVQDTGLVLLYHVQTYEACTQPVFSRIVFFAPYNFTLTADCPSNQAVANF